MSDKGSITAFYTVLVEGDDMNEPIADTVRGILDGHIVLSRKIASENHYPAIDVQSSISRLMKEITDDTHYQLSGKLKENLAIYAESKDLIDVGAYRQGSNPLVDRAIQLNRPIKDFLKQNVDAPSTFEETKAALSQIMQGA